MYIYVYMYSWHVLNIVYYMCIYVYIYICLCVCVCVCVCVYSYNVLNIIYIYICYMCIYTIYGDFFFDMTQRVVTGASEAPRSQRSLRHPWGGGEVWELSVSIWWVDGMSPWAPWYGGFWAIGSRNDGRNGGLMVGFPWVFMGLTF